MKLAFRRAKSLTLPIHTVACNILEGGQSINIKNIMEIVYATDSAFQKGFISQQEAERIFQSILQRSDIGLQSWVAAEAYIYQFYLED